MHKICLLLAALFADALATGGYGGGEVLAAGPIVGADYGGASAVGHEFYDGGLASGCLGGDCGGGAVAGDIALGSDGSHGPVAVISHQQTAYIPVPSVLPPPQHLLIEAHRPPVLMSLRTFSSPVKMEHHHVGQRGSVRHTESIDEPHQHVHTVKKPILQEVREIITPQRLIRQEILPVQEKVLTKVARGHHHHRAPLPLRGAPIGLGAGLMGGHGLGYGGAGLLGGHGLGYGGAGLLGGHGLGGGGALIGAPLFVGSLKGDSYGGMPGTIGGLGLRPLAHAKGVAAPVHGPPAIGYNGIPADY